MAKKSATADAIELEPVTESSRIADLETAVLLLLFVVNQLVHKEKIDRLAMEPEIENAGAVIAYNRSRAGVA